MNSAMKNQSLSVGEAALQLPKETAPSNSWLAMGKSLPEQVWLLKSLWFASVDLEDAVGSSI